MLRKLAGMILKRRGTTGQAQHAPTWKAAPDDWQLYFPDPAREARRARLAAEVEMPEWAFASPAADRAWPLR